MLRHPLEVRRPGAASPFDVRVTSDPLGGWRVDAVRDGRIVASRHCDDWHRVERARDALAAGLPESAAPAAMAGVR